jgi:hypothetical protein
MGPWNDTQKAKIKAVLEAEPCLYNARHKRDYLTMANWMNEVGKKQIATPEIVAEIMAPKAGDRWDMQAGKYVAVEQAPPPTAEDQAAAKVDPWAKQRAALGDVL